MRLVTRGDLDGLTSAIIITMKEKIDEILLVHPQEITDKAVEITPNDILANVPYHPKCGMWFDHHLLTASNERPPESFKGRYGLAPSAARLVFDYYSERDPNDEALKRLSTLVDEMKKVRLEIAESCAAIDRVSEEDVIARVFYVVGSELRGVETIRFIDERFKPLQ